jgi:hypothetical protein
MSLLHCTSDLDKLCGIVVAGFAKMQCARPVLESLGFPPFYSRLGMTCLTQLSLGNSETHRRKYGDFGMVVMEEWALEHHYQPVIYIPKCGPIYDLATKPLRAFKEEVEGQLLQQRWTKGPERVVCTSDASDIWSEEEAICEFLKEYRPLSATDRPLKRLIDLVEFEDKSSELEWRAITLDAYASDNVDAQRNQATGLSLANNPWQYHFAHQKKRPSFDREGITRDVPLAVFDPNDVLNFFCPHGQKEALQDKLPPPYRSHKILEVNPVYRQS